jgi:hypothetical protein
MRFCWPSICTIVSLVLQLIVLGCLLWHAIRGVAGGFPFGFLLEEVVEDWPVVFEVVVWNGEAARRADLMYVNEDDAAGTGDAIHFVGFDELIEARSTVFENSAVPEQPHDPGWSFESVQHDRYAVVAGLVDMRDRLISGTGEFLIPERLAVKDTEVLAAFGRDIDMTVARQRCRADEEHLLIQDPLDERLCCVSGCCARKVELWY